MFFEKPGFLFKGDSGFLVQRREAEQIPEAGGELEGEGSAPFGQVIGLRNMNFSELMGIRQSVRSYQERPVEPEKLQAIVESVRLAPSASNSQPWTLIIVDEPSLRDRVARATFNSTISFNRFSLEAPVIAVLTIEKPKVITQIGGWMKQREFSLIDIGIAAEHFCLQATDLGLGTCILGWFDEKVIKQLLNIPRSTRVALLITLGYAAEGYPLRPKMRKDIDTMSRHNAYRL
jgi:nitroreductase